MDNSGALTIVVSLLRGSVIMTMTVEMVQMKWDVVSCCTSTLLCQVHQSYTVLHSPLLKMIAENDCWKFFSDMIFICLSVCLSVCLWVPEMNEISHTNFPKISHTNPLTISAAKFYIPICYRPQTWQFYLSFAARSIFGTHKVPGLISSSWIPIILNPLRPNGN